MLPLRDLVVDLGQFSLLVAIFLDLSVEEQRNSKACSQILEGKEAVCHRVESYTLDLQEHQKDEHAG